VYLKKLINIFYKKAQQLQGLKIVAPQLLDDQEKNTFINHIIRITKESDTLIKAIKNSIPFQQISPESRSHAENLKTDSIRLNELATQADPPSQDNLDNLFKKMMNEYNTLEKSYIDPKLKQMKLIKESLAYLGSRQVLSDNG